MNGEPGDNTTADRYQVVLHVTADKVPSGQTLEPVQMAAQDDNFTGKKRLYAFRIIDAKEFRQASASLFRRVAGKDSALEREVESAQPASLAPL